MSKKKIAAVVLTTVALSAGSVGIADAASKTTKVIKRTTVTKTFSSVANSKVGGPIDSVLSALVAKGTITQAQMDAIKAALVAARPADGMGKGGKGGKGGGFVDPAARDALIASTLGIDATTLKSRLTAGETLSAIAGANKAALISALVAQESAAIDAAVTAGKITAAQATTLKANLTAHVTEEVNSTRPMGGLGHGPQSGTTSSGLPSGTTNGIPQTN